MEQNMQDMPVHIINGFQFNKKSAALFGYALDLVRLGAEIDESFWIDHIRPQDEKADLMHTISISGPVIRHREFDLFDSLDKCRRNAHIILEGLIDGMSTICSELETAFLAEDGPSLHICKSNQNMFRNETLQYLTRPAEEQDILLCAAGRRQAAQLYDTESVLLAIRGIESSWQYVWNGEWRALLASDEETRSTHFRRWYYNHVLTIHRLRHALSCHLYTVYPEHFNRGKNA
ncbi:hypothetical protein pEaSNUABM40_00032 [Erwinia phage pEa_SNUABM_40]|uniref:Uncharacterized protein n=1 Tax=Erwinia phage pEa_SNUABM_3 TaxID=2869552 RepID=A0AAE8BYG7_9CAUD|nr:hypothetical protein MPK68_gp032 [Erwinia phage pEa_SNUABM_3]QZE56568.1 hypothetical protein pEaSNUABM20_00032 [Erwinia phage pEa_SNUABM_20]QZE58248.1 hypothetical protein pEaSNUABM40_00032 [Erwinia phage pEa_SNUABM_40]UAW52814.1 hypothetical protein pEaSNUABM23_00032 [Erwinia phage pEa_SNUABM_23]UIW10710.1 hypothetical protein pEaSNUABM23_00032 [Erwinia phage pEa_SNUABM_31]QZE56229.1 hypothetical protein pEaSNUABM3_00032 [Erwinia phage pEa_SNUABM_3]